VQAAVHLHRRQRAGLGDLVRGLVVIVIVAYRREDL
jgi:hypothetical protein